MERTEAPIPEPILAALKRGETTNCLKLLEQFIEQHPESHQARTALANLYLQVQEHHKALPHLQILARTCPSAQLLAVLAHLSEAYGFLQESCAHLRKAIELAPGEKSLLESYLRLSDRLNPGSSFQLLAESADHFKEQPTLLDFIFPSTLALEEYLHKKIFRNSEPILFIGIAHSAGAYISATLAQRLGMYKWAEPLAIGSHHHSFIYEPHLERFLKLGGVNHTHTFPGAINRAMLLASGIGKIIVNTRDPRQLVLSNAHWMLELKRRSTEPGISKYEPAMLKEYLPDNYYTLSFEEQINWMIENDLPDLNRWMQGWYDFAHEAAGKIQIKFMRFEDFKADPDSYFAEILQFYNLPSAEWRGEAEKCAPKADGRPGAHAFRKGRIDEWRQEMTAAQQERCNQLTPAEFLSQFRYLR